MNFEFKIIKTIYLLVIFLTLLPAQPMENALEEIVRVALHDQRGYQLLEELCALGPRLSGSSGSLQAIQWASSIMEKAGFDSVWLQPVIVPYWQRGELELVEIIRPKKFSGRKLSIAALGGSIGTSAKGISGIASFVAIAISLLVVVIDVWLLLIVILGSFGILV